MTTYDELMRALRDEKRFTAIFDKNQPLPRDVLSVNGPFYLQGLSCVHLRLGHSTKAGEQHTYDEEWHMLLGTPTTLLGYIIGGRDTEWRSKNGQTVIRFSTPIQGSSRHSMTGYLIQEGNDSAESWLVRLAADTNHGLAAIQFKVKSTEPDSLDKMERILDGKFTEEVYENIAQSIPSLFRASNLFVNNLSAEQTSGCSRITLDGEAMLRCIDVVVHRYTRQIPFVVDSRHQAYAVIHSGNGEINLNIGTILGNDFRPPLAEMRVIPVESMLGNGYTQSPHSKQHSYGEQQKAWLCSYRRNADESMFHTEGLAKVESLRQ